jgi:hypothetical protein
VFFSHNKPANSTFSYNKPTKRIWCKTSKSIPYTGPYVVALPAPPSKSARACSQPAPGTSSRALPSLPNQRGVMALPHARWLPGKLRKLRLPLPQSVATRAPQSFVVLATHLPQSGNPRILLRITLSFQNQAVPSALAYSSCRHLLVLAATAESARPQQLGAERPPSGLASGDESALAPSQRGEEPAKNGRPARPCPVQLHKSGEERPPPPRPLPPPRASPPQRRSSRRSTSSTVAAHARRQGALPRADAQLEPERTATDVEAKAIVAAYKSAAANLIASTRSYVPASVSSVVVSSMQP